MQQLAMFEAPRPCAPANNGTQGSQANHSGQVAEDTIYCVLKERGYDVQRQVWLGKGQKKGGTRVDFMVFGHKDFPNGLIIESKWQETSGSADEKLYGLLAKIQTRYPCPTVVVIGGGGARESIIDYLRNHVGFQNLHAVLTFDEFMAWIIRNF